MKTPSKDLWKLIQSMTISEKGYFVKFARRHIKDKDNNYIKLFTAVNIQVNEYDENQIKNNFRKEKFIKQLTSAKNYLYNMILKSLVSYNDDKTTDSVLSNLKSQYTILYRKTLFEQAEVILNRAKKIASDADRFSKLADILQDQRNFDYRKIAEQGFDKYISGSISEQLEILDKQKNIAQYNALYLKLSSLFKKIGIARNRNDLRLFEKIIKHPLMKSESLALSVSAKNLFYIINYLYYYCIKDNQNAFEFSIKRLELIENNPEKISGGIKEYLYSLSDAIAMSYNLKRYDLCISYLRKQREISDKNDVSSAVPNHLEMYCKSYSFELNIFIISGFFKEGMNVVDEVIQWLKKYNERINKSEELKVIYTIAYLYFGAGDLSRSIIWLNKILSDNSDYRQDYKAFARILNLIIHYELENYDLLEYELKSVKRFLIKKDKLYPYEDLILASFRKLPDITEKKERHFQLGLLKDQISKIIKESNDYMAIEYFDILSWIDSKLQSKNFSEIVKSHSKIRLSDLKPD